MGNKKEDILKQIISTKKEFEKAGISESFVADVRFDEKSLSETDGYLYIEGYACTGDKDWVDDIIENEAMAGSAKDLLRPGCKTVFYNHDTDQPIGLTEESYFDGNGIKVKVKVSNANDVADIRIKLKEGVLNSFSIKGYFKQIEIERDSEGDPIAWHIKEMDLMEVSVVGLPCNTMAAILETMEKSIKKNFGGLTRKVGKKTKSSSKTEGVKKKRSGKMADKETVLEILKEHSGAIIDDQVKKAVEAIEPKLDEMVKSAVNPLTEKLDEMGTAIKTFVEGYQKDEEKSKKDEEKGKEKSKKGEEKEEDSMSDAVKGLMETIGALSTTVKELKESNNQRKGFQRDDKEDENEDVVKKSLDSVENEDTVKYLDYLMNDPEGHEAHKKLSEVDRKKANAMYFMAMAENGNVKK